MRALLVLAVVAALTSCGGGGGGGSQSGSGGDPASEKAVPDIAVSGNTASKNAAPGNASLDGIWEVSRTGRREFSNPDRDTDIHSTHRLRVSDGRISPLTEDDVLCSFGLHDFAEITNNRVSYRKPGGVNCTMDERNCRIYGYCYPVGEVCSVKIHVMELIFSGDRFQGELIEGVNCDGQGSFARTSLEGRKR